MRSALSQALKIFFSPETIAPFLVGSIVLAILGGAVYDILKNTFGSETPDLIQIAVIALLILILSIMFVGWTIAQRVARLPVHIPFEVRQKQLDRQYQGLILLVSQPEACETAIRFHLPVLKRCWLICSSYTFNKAQDLRQRFPKVCVAQPIVVNDIYDPLEIRDQVDDIYRTRLPKGWKESDVIADYTGMTAHASVGTVLACLKTNRPLQYTPAKVDQQGKIIGSLNPIRILLNQET